MKKPESSNAPKTHAIKTPDEEQMVETYVTIPPDGGWGWVVVVAAFLAYMISDGLTYSFGVLIHDLSVSFDCTEGKLSIVTGVSSFIYCVTGPLQAALVNRYGFRVVSIMGSIITAGAMFLSSLFSNLWFLTLFYGVLGGVGMGMIYITAVIVVGFYFEKYRSLATGIAVTGAGVGSVAFPPLFTLLLESQGWRSTFRVLAIIAALTIICGFTYRPIPETLVLVRPEPTKLHSRRSSFFKRYSNEQFGKISDHLPPIVEDNEGKPTTSRQAAQMPVNIRRKWKAFSRCCKRKFTKHSRPLYKDDIFYSTSVKNLHSKSQLEYQLSVTRIHTDVGAVEADTCECCPLPVKRTLAMMLDLHLFKSLPFVLLLVNAATMYLGTYVPYLFIKDALIKHGCGQNIAFWFVSIIGLANTFGRIGCGLLSNMPNYNAIVITYVALLVGGISTICAPFCYAVWYQVMFCLIFGFSIASISALRSIIIVDMLGLEKLTNAIGILLVFQGIGTLIGNSLAGYLNDLTGDFKWSFLYSGICIVISALTLVVAHLIILARPKAYRLNNL